MGKAVAIYPYYRERYLDGSFSEWVVWQLDAPVPPCTHPYKYRLAYIVNGERVIGYDNERGKGDHMPLDGKESPYTFTTPGQLLADFQHAVNRWMEQTP